MQQHTSSELCTSEPMILSLKYYHLAPALKNKFSYFPSKTYVAGTQKNRLNEMVLLSTQNKCKN